MEITRSALEYLAHWKKSSSRKPLIIRGARQVGKTTLVRQFGAGFENFIELNLEKREDRELFQIEDIHQLIGAILVSRKILLQGKPLLLFIDEIQEEPRAIASLRYFYEERPDVFVISAGSLLDFALKLVPSFPVGRVSYLYMHPLNFPEYLMAIGDPGSIEILDQYPPVEYAHDIILKRFHEFATIGGMPEVVAEFRNNEDYSIVPKITAEIWQSYKDDIEKYGKNNTERNVIRHIVDAAPHQPDRIKMEGFGQSNYKSREVGEALRALHLARIIRLVYPSTSLQPPLTTEKRRRPRLQFIDTGLLSYALNLTGQMIGLSDLNDLQRGKIAQHIVTQELISRHEYTDYVPNFWVREEKDNSAEVDLVYPYKNLLIPIEVKAGKQGKLRSLHQFVERSGHPYAVRLFAGKFSVEEHKTPGGKEYLLMNLPYYLAFKIPEYLEFFVEKYSLNK